MKKLFIILSAVVALAACSKSEIAEINEPKQEETVSTPVTFNVTVDEMGVTKALKSAWANGDKIYIKFNGINDKYMYITYNGSSWDVTQSTSFTTADFDGKTLTLGAVHYPVDVTTFFTGSNQLDFEQSGDIPSCYYMYQSGAAYTVDGTNVNIKLSLQKPDRLVLFHIPGIQANPGNYSLKIKVNDDSGYKVILPSCVINEDGTVAHSNHGLEGVSIPGIADEDGAIFTGYLNPEGFSGSSKSLTITVTESGVQEYSKTLTTTLVAGKQYSLPALNDAKWTPKFKAFTINSSNDKVYISPGNLQATTTDYGENWTWSFAAHQWDYVGNATANNTINGNGTVSANGTVDLFGWVGASNTTWSGAAMYGISNSTTTNSTDTYGNVTDEALKSDWGNTIGSGWRTLTTDEWYYLFKLRASGSTVNGTSDARYTFATINTDGTPVKGIILFPNDVTIDNSEATSWQVINGGSDNWGTKCTSAQWTTLEAKGCVFLPTAGAYRVGTTVEGNTAEGAYWSSSGYGTQMARRVHFSSTNMTADNTAFRHYGQSVRLVMDVQ